MMVSLCIVLEGDGAFKHLDGKKMRRAQGERLPPALAVFVAMELVGALVHAHESEDNRGLALRIVRSQRIEFPQNLKLHPRWTEHSQEPCLGGLR